MKVLFVCLGNICRSPAAEGIFQALLKEQGLTELFTVDSAGTASYHIGELPDERMRATSLEHGIELNSRARQYQSSDGEKFDFIVAMDESNLSNIRAITPQEFHSKTFLLRDYDKFDTDPDVPDPYYGGMDGFENTYRIIERSLREFLKAIREKG